MFKVYWTFQESVLSVYIEECLVLRTKTTLSGHKEQCSFACMSRHSMNETDNVCLAKLGILTSKDLNVDLTECVIHP